MPSWHGDVQLYLLFDAYLAVCVPFKRFGCSIRVVTNSRRVTVISVMYRNVVKKCVQIQSKFTAGNVIVSIKNMSVT
jgi:hypothetical protein